MPTNAPSSLSLFWFHWILANATSIGVAHALAGLFATIDDNPRGLLFLIPITLTTPLLIGYGQQVVLQRWLPDVDHWFALMPLNLVLGFVGLAVGWLIGWILVELFRPLPIGALADLIMLTSLSLGYGAGFGILQAICMGLSRRGALLWFAASGAGFSLAIVAEMVLGAAVFQSSSQMTTVGASSLLGTVGGAVYGLITGGALVLLCLHVRK